MPLCRPTSEPLQSLTYRMCQSDGSRIMPLGDLRGLLTLSLGSYVGGLTIFVAEGLSSNTLLDRRTVAKPAEAEL